MQQNHSLYLWVSSFHMMDHSIFHPLPPVLLLSHHKYDCFNPRNLLFPMVYPVALHQTVDVLPLPMTPCVFSFIVQSSILVVSHLLKGSTSASDISEVSLCHIGFPLNSQFFCHLGYFPDCVHNKYLPRPPGFRIQYRTIMLSIHTGQLFNV